MVCETASAVSILSVSPRQATFLSRRACYRLLITSINTAGGGDELNRPLGGVAPAPGPGRHVPCGAPNGCGAGAVRAQISRTSAERLRE
jgi:hypothetical protein